MRSREAAYGHEGAKAGTEVQEATSETVEHGEKPEDAESAGRSDPNSLPQLAASGRDNAAADRETRQGYPARRSGAAGMAADSPAPRII